MQGGFISFLGLRGFFDVVAVGLVDRQGIGNFQHPLFNPLQLITGPGQHQHQKKVHHGGHRGFRLANPYGFHNDDIEPGRLAQQHGFPGLAGDTAQAAPGGRGSDKRHGLDAKLLHTGFVGHDAPAAAGAARIHGQNRQAMPLAGQVHTENFDEGTLAHPGHAGNAQPNRLASVRQQAIDDRGRHLPMLRQAALDQGDGPG